MAEILLADRTGEALCVADLVVFFISAEADRECLVNIRSSGDIARIDAGGKEAADLDVCDLVRTDGILEGLGDGLHPVAEQRVLVRPEFHIPVALDGELAVLIDEIMRGQELFHALEECLLRRGILEREILLQHIGVELLFEMRMREKCLDLAAEHECAVHLRIIHRLDAEEIACTEKALPVFIPDDEREHAAKPVQKPGAVFRVAVDQHLRIGLCAEAVPLCTQLPAQFLIIINLAVEDQYE